MRWLIALILCFLWWPIAVGFLAFMFWTDNLYTTPEVNKNG